MTLVDTSSWIEFLRERQSSPASRVKELIKTDEAAWCDLIAVELWSGVRPGYETKSLAELETVVTLLPMDEEVWQTARKLAFQSRRAGITAPVAHIAIAACAARYRLEMEHFDGHYDQLMPVAAKL